ncbi:M3 family metallopeptidase [Neisseria sp. ZJ106]|uniref:oligopeptidase A n=1 Tax=Neisseria lisongii TaxID=2912188 RepID=A0ABY7RIH4_9NEIS|nr:M3 family metallopeptidase [Neisseria lisongii]MCF7522120.1 M3 family metallopeptidase [Neisseria lisongii]WCL71109.1 M3 family metallopeptidase [Neisseria lisongii]
MNDNVLLQLGDEPAFDRIQTEHIKPALQSAMQQAREAVAAVKAQPQTTWLNTVERLTDITERVGRIWGVVAHLNSVVDTPQLRAVYNELMPEVTVFFSEISQDIELYERFKAIKASEAFAKLTPAQQTKLNHDLRDFVLSGAELPPEQQAKLAALQTESAQLSAQFSQNVLDATDAFALYFDDAAELAGIQEDALAMFAAAAQAEGKTGYKIGLQMPHYLAVMQYADNRALREQMYRAYVTRASELSNEGKFDNTANIDRCLEIGLETAHLLGFDNYAELSLATKMADTPAQVLAFLRNLAAQAKPFAEQDFAEVKAFAADTLGIADFQSWDLAYAGEKLRQAKYSFSETEVKKYFPAGKVLAGLFAQINRLYGVNFIEKTVPVWHKDVRYFELENGGAIIGGVYLDLYAREGKRGGAWMNDYKGRRRFADGEKAGQLQIPTAYLVCNFTPPLAGKEARLSHDEILTLFHEMGHGLHHLLTQEEELGVSGINGVEWDAVELPSQFMENFVWEYDVLAEMSAHEETGAALPQALFDKMVAAKNFQRGMFMVRQMEFALFDMLIYSESDQGRLKNWAAVLDSVRQEVAVSIPPTYNRFANSFGHIFAGGYSAGYYSYAWAEVLSADAYAAFEESDDVRATGKRFWREILAVGGGRSAAESFKAFRGREPSIDALLRHSGFKAA